jgi:E3 ubiquitin-protein ligase DOA10
MSNHTSTHIPTHGGLDRVIERAEATQGVIASIFSAKQLPTYVLGLTIMAVVTLTERAMDATNAGFALEWAALSVVALATFGLLAKAIVRGTRSAQAWFTDYAKHARQTRADVAMWAAARRDPRTMNDILAAQGRHEAMQDERIAAPRAGHSQHVTKKIADDGLAALAPWAQLTRYY